MDKKERGWAFVVLISVLLAYIVPYTLLRNVDAWYGSFLFWSLFGVVVILINFVITRDWVD